MIRLSGVTKIYKTENHRKVVLDNVTYTFDTRYSYGIFGPNGAGKSTLLRLIAGTELPNSGRIKCDVRVSWPLGFAGGFHSAMTGRENVKFVSRIYGANTRRVIEFVDYFAELGNYFDMPVNTYSSGMGARLAFGLSMAMDFECYLVDELTAVGDARFALRARQAFDEKRGRSSMIMVSHDIGTVKAYCERGLVLHRGKLLAFGDLDDAIEFYRKVH
ncbi:ABC transporter related [Methylocella silvestris BL2]|uniref:ABC transporter related n=1 Tax=Methylocella silvestris (strain DSM 15510 / CIP 108128 / LMG 27833 / NCIMB 13906 / BL2) TaxID=395965 RepID=B8ERV4_METSB|nr:ABC transporter ATP-binding protein [Methylocella silvestris]ACK51652.1 ABC transporter related [Methylocella silvestris BL2]